MNITRMFLIGISVIIFSIVVYFVVDLVTKTRVPAQPEHPIAEINVTDRAEPSILVEDFGNNSKYYTAPSFKFEEGTPEQAQIFAYSDTNFYTDSSLNSLYQALGVVKTGTHSNQVIGQTIYAENESSNLTIYLDRKTFEYTSTYEFELENLDAHKNMPEYQKQAEVFMTEAGIDFSGYTFDNYSYLSTNTSQPVVVDHPQQGHLVELIYRANVDGYPIVDKQDSLTANFIRFWINKDLAVIKVYAQNIGTAEQGSELFRLKTLQQIEKEIENEKAKLIQADVPVGEKIITTEIRTAKLSYYRVDNYLSPVYILEGVSKTDQGGTGPAYLIIDAIE